jgi:dGTPase
MDLDSPRSKRFHEEGGARDQRAPFQRDRDRILYSTAFRRLGGVTQVVGVSEGHQFHNRLTHTLKVGQIARRIAEHLLTPDRSGELAQVAEAQLHPDVAEAAALAHDIGHPPFGHVAEEELRELVDRELGEANQEGFEGNAQSFRIVTQLSLRTTKYDGLNLTRATLRAILKYPWLRAADLTEKKRRTKWGAYPSEQREFDFATDRSPQFTRSIEAEIMDWSDDIAYSVHDLEDFWKAGVIPLGRLAKSRQFLDEFLRETHRYWRHAVPNESGIDKSVSVMTRTADDILGTLPPAMLEEYDGRTAQRADARQWTSSLVGRYVQRAISLRREEGKPDIVAVIEPEPKLQVEFLKTLTRRFAIFNPSLAAQQHGYCRLIRELFESFLEIAKTDRAALPYRYQDALKKREQAATSDAQMQSARVRVVVDFISSLTEPEAAEVHGRLRGIHAGKVIDPIVR